MKSFYALLVLVQMWFHGSGAPLREAKEILFVPANRLVPLPLTPNNNYPYRQPFINPNINPQIRGPFSFIGDWIQSTGWFPIEVNIPDAFNNVGSGFNQFTQGVGNGFTQFTQGLGSGFQQATQTVGNGLNGFVQNATQVVPFLGNIVRPRFPTQGNVVVVVPTHDKVDFDKAVLGNSVAGSIADDVLIGYP